MLNVNYSKDDVINVALLFFWTLTTIGGTMPTGFGEEEARKG